MCFLVSRCGSSSDQHPLVLLFYAPASDNRSVPLPTQNNKEAIFLKGFGTQRDFTNRSAERSPEKNMKTTVKVGLMTLLAGSFMASSLSVMAADQLDSWKVRGLTRPGAWFANNTTDKPVPIGLSNSVQGV